MVIIMTDNKKVCILICGLKRDFKKIKKNIKSNFLDQLDINNISYDIFVHSDKFIKISNLKGNIIKNPKQYYNISIPRQFSRFHECYYKLIKPYMNINKIEYDFFICTRPDNYYFKNCLIRIQEWDDNKLNVRMRNYPHSLDLIYHTGILGKKNYEIIDDQFFIVPKKIADLAFSIKKGGKPILCQKNGWNECKITRLWNSNKLEFKLLPINIMIYNWKYDKNKYFFNKRIDIQKHYL